MMAWASLAKAHRCLSAVWLDRMPCGQHLLGHSVLENCEAAPQGTEGSIESTGSLAATSIPTPLPPLRGFKAATTAQGAPPVVLRELPASAARSKLSPRFLSASVEGSRESCSGNGWSGQESCSVHRWSDGEREPPLGTSYSGSHYGYRCSFCYGRLGGLSPASPAEASQSTAIVPFWGHGGILGYSPEDASIRLDTSKKLSMQDTNSFECRILAI